MGNFLTLAATLAVNQGKQWKLCRKSSGCRRLAVERQLRMVALTPRAFRSKVSRIQFVNPKRNLGDCPEKDYNRSPEPSGSFRSNRRSHVWYRDGMLQAHHGLLQERRYEVLCVKPGYESEVSSLTSGRGASLKFGGRRGEVLQDGPEGTRVDASSSLSRARFGLRNTWNFLG
jgi:hypothetical protein